MLIKWKGIEKARLYLAIRGAGVNVIKTGSAVTAGLEWAFRNGGSHHGQRLFDPGHDALLAEADFSHRGGSRVKLDGAAVRVEIAADDPVSLRASLNSYLRLMSIIKDIKSIYRGQLSCFKLRITFMCN